MHGSVSDALFSIFVSSHRLSRHLKGVTAEEEVLLRFSLKECLYKAMHPLICQYVGFQEASVRPTADGTAVPVLDLESGAHRGFGPVTAHWQRVLGNHFLSTSSVAAAPEAPKEWSR
jgi:4'-phosphopantetheinyl transferase EntD